MTAAEKQRDGVSKERRTQGKFPFRAGLTPTVERMFGALVIEPEEDQESSSSELDAEGAGPTSSR